MVNTQQIRIFNLNNLRTGYNPALKDNTARPAIILENLDKKLGLDLLLVPSHHDFLLGQITGLKPKYQYKLEKLTRKEDLDINRINNILRKANLRIAGNSPVFRINEIGEAKTRTINEFFPLTRLSFAVLNGLGIKLPVFMQNKTPDNVFLSKSSKNISGTYIKKKPTQEEYEDNALMRKAIEDNKNKFLRDINEGFTVKNIMLKEFFHSSFNYMDKRGTEKTFIGLTLLAKRGLKENIGDIVALLKTLNLEVNGEVKQIKENPSPTQEEYQDDRLMHKVILNNKDIFLKNIDLGFTIKNISLKEFCSSSYIYTDKKGVAKEFTGNSLLRNRGLKTCNIADMVKLLKTLKINVVGEVKQKIKLAPPSQEEYQDDELIQKVILENKDKFLKDIDHGFTVKNIRVHKFNDIKYRYIDEQGIEKGFSGEALLRNRGLRKTNIVVIVDLLKVLGIDVEGEAKLQKENPSPTLEEYQDNELMQKVILENIDKFLNDVDQGFKIKNIRVHKFAKSKYTYIDDQENEKDFVGEALLKNRGLKENIGDIVKLLKALNIEVVGNVRLPLPTQEEYKDNDLMKKVLIENKGKYLKNINNGFTVDNIGSAIFSIAHFVYKDNKGIEKGFYGSRLLINRGLKSGNITDIVQLLKDLGIDVTGELKPHNIRNDQKLIPFCLITAVSRWLGIPGWPSESGPFSEEENQYTQMFRQKLVDEGITYPEQLLEILNLGADVEIELADILPAIKHSAIKTHFPAFSYGKVPDIGYEDHIRSSYQANILRLIYILSGNNADNFIKYNGKTKGRSFCKQEVIKTLEALHVKFNGKGSEIEVKGVKKKVKSFYYPINGTEYQIMYSLDNGNISFYEMASPHQTPEKDIYKEIDIFKTKDNIYCPPTFRDEVTNTAITVFGRDFLLTRLKIVMLNEHFNSMKDMSHIVIDQLDYLHLIREYKDRLFDYFMNVFCEQRNTNKYSEEDFAKIVFDFKRFVEDLGITAGDTETIYREGLPIELMALRFPTRGERSSVKLMELIDRIKDGIIPNNMINRINNTRRIRKSDNSKTDIVKKIDKIAARRREKTILNGKQKEEAKPIKEKPDIKPKDYDKLENERLYDEFRWTLGILKRVGGKGINIDSFIEKANQIIELAKQHKLKREQKIEFAKIFRQLLENFGKNYINAPLNDNGDLDHIKLTGMSNEELNKRGYLKIVDETGLRIWMPEVSYELYKIFYELCIRLRITTEMGVKKPEWIK